MKKCSTDWWRNLEIEAVLNIRKCEVRLKKLEDISNKSMVEPDAEPVSGRLREKSLTENVENILHYKGSSTRGQFLKISPSSDNEYKFKSSDDSNDEDYMPYKASKMTEDDMAWKPGGMYHKKGSKRPTKNKRKKKSDKSVQHSAQLNETWKNGVSRNLVSQSVKSAQHSLKLNETCKNDVSRNSVSQSYVYQSAFTAGSVTNSNYKGTEKFRKTDNLVSQHISSLSTNLMQAIDGSKKKSGHNLPVKHELTQLSALNIRKFTSSEIMKTKHSKREVSSNWDNISNSSIEVIDIPDDNFDTSEKLGFMPAFKTGQSPSSNLKTQRKTCTKIQTLKREFPQTLHHTSNKLIKVANGSKNTSQKNMQTTRNPYLNKEFNSKWRMPQTNIFHSSGVSGVTSNISIESRASMKHQIRIKLEPNVSQVNPIVRRKDSNDEVQKTGCDLSPSLTLLDKFMMHGNTTLAQNIEDEHRYAKTILKSSYCDIFTELDAIAILAEADLDENPYAYIQYKIEDTEKVLKDLKAKNDDETELCWIENKKKSLECGKDFLLHFGSFINLSNHLLKSMN